MSWTPAELPLSFYKDLDRVMAEERARREADLMARYPRDYPRAKRASDSLRAKLGLAGKKNPGWLAGLCGAVDPCGRPYVSVSLSQWPSRGGLRLTTGPDGEVPAFPEKIDGVPVYVAVSGCFGQKTPGCNGEPCVPEADPVGDGLGQINYGEFGEAFERFKEKYSGRPWFVSARLASRPVFAIGPNVYEVVIRCDPFWKSLRQAALELPHDNLFEGKFHVVPLCASLVTSTVKEVDLDRVRAKMAKAAKISRAVDAQLGDLGELERGGGAESDSLPSGRAWLAFVRNGDVSALGEALGHTALRATLIGAGLWVAGARRETLVRDSVAGSLGVDAFILMWSLCQR